MAGMEVHLAQGEHNREVAFHLLEPPRHDWAITAAFYGAVHYVEAWLYDRPERHTETSIPLNADGEQRYSAHAWRERMIQVGLSRAGLTAFRKLRVASDIARYLLLSRAAGAVPATWTAVVAANYFTPEQARRLVENELEAIRREIRVEWLSLVEGLGLQALDPVAGPLVRQKLLDRFSGLQAFRDASGGNLRAIFGPKELQVLKTAVAAKGIPHPTLEAAQ